VSDDGFLLIFFYVWSTGLMWYVGFLDGRRRSTAEFDEMRKICKTLTIAKVAQPGEMPSDCVARIVRERS